MFSQNSTKAIIEFIKLASQWGVFYVFKGGGGAKFDLCGKCIHGWVWVFGDRKDMNS